MRMDDKSKRDGSNGRSLRTLTAINGKFEAMVIDGRSPDVQSCDKAASGIRDANGDVWHKGFCGRSSMENSSRELNGVRFHSDNGKRTENYAGVETHMAIKNKNKAQCPRAASFSKRASVVGRHGRDSEIDVFDAEKYFSSTHHEKLADQMETPVGSSNPHLDIDPVRLPGMKGACRGLSSDVSIIEGKLSQSSSIASSLDSKAVISESNNHSGLLSNATTSIFNGLPLNQRAGEPKHKWRIACRCPCASKKSIAISNSLLDQSGKIASLSTSVQSSPLRSNYSGVHSNSSHLSTDLSLNPELPKLKTKKSYRSEKNASVKNRISANGVPATSSGSLVRLQRDEEMDMRTHAMSRQFKRMEPREEDGIKNSAESQGEGFSFPNLPSPLTHSAVFSFPEEKPRLSLQVFGSSPDCNEKQSNNTQRRRRLLSADMADNSSSETRSSFSFPRLSFCSCESFDNRDMGFDNGYNYTAMKLDNNPNTVEDDKSDSSSDLFELESLSTDASAPYTIYKTAINHGGIELKGCSHSYSCQSSATVDPWHEIHHSQVTKLLSSGIANVRKEYRTSLDKNCMNNLDMMIKRSEENTRSTSIANGSPTEFSMPIKSGMLLGSYRKDKTAHAVTVPVSPQLTKPTQQQLIRTSCRTAQQDSVFGQPRPSKPR